MHSAPDDVIPCAPGRGAGTRHRKAGPADWVVRAVGRSLRPHSIRIWLSLMVVAAMLPSVAMAILLVNHFYLRERDEIARSTLATTRALMQAVDQSLAGAQSALRVLASSPAIEAGDIEALYRQAQASLPSQAFTIVDLIDSTGQPFFNTLRPLGEALPPYPNMALLGLVLASGQPGVSDLYIGSVSHVPLINIAVPVLSHGTPVGVLVAGLLPDRLGEVLRRQQLPQGWVAAIVDGNGAFIARARGGPLPASEKITAEVARAIAAAPEGVVNSVNRDGVPIFVSFSRLPLSSWTVLVGVPVAERTAELRRSILISGAGAVFLLGLGMLGARAIGGLVGRSIASLQAPALALAEDRHPALPGSAITEVNAVGGALLIAAGLLDRRAAERARAEATLRETVRDLVARTSELEHANADLERLAYAAAHDLKAPLGAIKHLADWIAEETAPAASTTTVEHLVLLQARANRLLMLLDGLQAYARLGRQRAVVEPIDPAALVRGITAALAPPPGFSVTCAEPMPVFAGHRVALERVLDVLIANALRHHDRDRGAITVTGRLAGGVAEFRVTDDGPGIDPRFHERIFAMFQTLASRDVVETSGIGLAIARKLIEGHGGRIWIDSAPAARGATFAFTWRVASSF